MLENDKVYLALSVCRLRIHEFDYGKKSMKVACSIFLLVVCMAGTLVAEETLSFEKLRAMRREATSLKRRILFNNDGNSIVYRVHDKPVSVDSLLDDRMISLAGTNVDTIMYCTWCGIGGHTTRMSNVIERLYSKQGILAKNMTEEYHNAGIDPLSAIVDFGKKKGIEVFWSLRMNDQHDGLGYPDLLANFKTAHPELLFAPMGSGVTFGAWSGLDYTHQAVRDRAFAEFVEVCNGYHIDGIEMDFMRHMPHFRRMAFGDGCTQKDRDLMSALVKRIREMTEEVGMRRGRPILVSVRIPASVSACEANGLDILRWLDEGWLDMMFPGEWEFSHWDKWIEMGREKGVKVYPCLNWTGSKKRRGPATKNEQPAVRMRNLLARAMNIYRAGGEGIYVFNLPDGPFPPSHPIYRQLGDPELLATLDKDYFPHGYWRVMTTDPHRFRILSPFVEIPIPPRPEQKVTLAAGQSINVQMLMGDDIIGAPKNPVVTLSLGIADLKTDEPIKAALNAHPLGPGKVIFDNWITYPVMNDWLISGDNSVTIKHKKGSTAIVVVRDVHIKVDY